MLNRFKNKLANIVNGISNYQNRDDDGLSLHVTNDVSPFTYTRPAFLNLSPDEVQVSADHISRPILVARNGSTLPWCAGYAEVINAGKTKVNEDQARVETWAPPRRAGSTPRSEGDGEQTTSDSQQASELSDAAIIHYFGIFDGHAGTGAALMAVNILHLIIQDKLLEVQNLLDPTQPLLNNGLMNQAGIPQSPLPQSPTTPPFSPSPQLSDLSPTTTSNPFLAVLADQEPGDIAEEQSPQDPSEPRPEVPDPETADLENDGVPDPEAVPQAMDTAPSGGSEVISDNMGAEAAAVGVTPDGSSESPSSTVKSSPRSKPLLSLNLDKFNVENMIVGALEASFFDMDAVICRERRVYRVPGGCTSLVAVFFKGKLYIANAGDSRAVMCYKMQAQPLSKDFTPETDRKRIQLMAWHHPELLCNMFSPIQFAHRVTRKDIGKRVLHRDGWRRGWAYKTVTEEDIKMPLIYGEGKKARLLGTIGVSRGFGDHDLRVYESEVYVKPFMTCAPEVRVYDLTRQEHTEDDVLIMGTDGLWDVTSNEKAAGIVQASLAQFKPDDPNRYVSAAQELVMHARGVLKGGWRTTEDKLASGDDITVFVIPLHCHSNTFSKSCAQSSLDQ